MDALRAAERRGVSEAVRASFIALIEGGWWTQYKLFFHGLATDPFCRKCCADHGTLWHRVSGQCRTNDSAGPVASIVEQGKTRRWDPLFSRCVPAMPLVPSPPSERVWCFPENAADVRITGDVFTDGALRGLQLEVRRGGWAFAKLGENT